MRAAGPPTLALAALLVAGCTGGSSSIEVSGAETPEPAMPDMGAVYLEITNDGDGNDALVTARTDVADTMELHETVVEDGQASMHEVGEIPVPAGETVTLERGGLHLMLLDPEPLAVGDTYDLELVFDAHDPVTVSVEVVDPSEGDHGGDEDEDDDH